MTLDFSEADLDVLKDSGVSSKYAKSNRRRNISTPSMAIASQSSQTHIDGIKTFMITKQPIAKQMMDYDDVRQY